MHVRACKGSQTDSTHTVASNYTALLYVILHYNYALCDALCAFGCQDMHAHIRRYLKAWPWTRCNHLANKHGSNYHVCLISCSDIIIAQGYKQHRPSWAQYLTQLLNTIFKFPQGWIHFNSVHPFVLHYMSETKCSTMFHSMTGNWLLFHAVSTIVEANPTIWNHCSVPTRSLSLSRGATLEISTAIPKPKRTVGKDFFTKEALHQWLFECSPLPKQRYNVCCFSPKPKAYEAFCSASAAAIARLSAQGTLRSCNNVAVQAIQIQVVAVGLNPAMHQHAGLKTWSFVWVLRLLSGTEVQVFGRGCLPPQKHLQSSACMCMGSFTDLVTPSRVVKITSLGDGLW